MISLSEVTFLVSDIIVNKALIIERCIKRIREEYDCDPENLNNFTKQDSMVLNIQRACEAAIDLSMHVVSDKKIGVPQTSREGFALLEDKGIIPSDLANKLKSMVGFRNIAVHNYQNLNLSILQEIIENRLEDLREFSRIMLASMET
jgi:uncharacterized protein YutE (UPF0331/DUF86 family)